jgi:hypothetical protein
MLTVQDTFMFSSFAGFVPRPVSRPVLLVDSTPLPILHDPLTTEKLSVTAPLEKSNGPTKEQPQQQLDVENQCI